MAHSMKKILSIIKQIIVFGMIAIGLYFAYKMDKRNSIKNDKSPNYGYMLKTKKDLLASYEYQLKVINNEINNPRVCCRTGKPIPHGYTQDPRPELMIKCENLRKQIFSIEAKARH